MCRYVLCVVGPNQSAPPPSHPSSPTPGSEDSFGNGLDSFGLAHHTAGQCHLQPQQALLLGLIQARHWDARPPRNHLRNLWGGDTTWGLHVGDRSRQPTKTGTRLSSRQPPWETGPWTKMGVWVVTIYFIPPPLVAKISETGTPGMGS